jgi:hypothetical protein
VTSAETSRVHGARRSRDAVRVRLTEPLALCYAWEHGFVVRGENGHDVQCAPLRQWIGEERKESWKGMEGSARKLLQNAFGGLVKAYWSITHNFENQPLLVPNYLSLVPLSISHQELKRPCNKHESQSSAINNNSIRQRFIHSTIIPGA